MTLDWDDVRLFLAVARAGSLRAAARLLGLSQPTVGRRLARFEAATGPAPLFDRLPEGMRLTAAGKGLVPVAEQLEAAARALQGRRASAADRPASVRISVGEWAGGFLARCLAGPDRHPLPDGLAIELMVSDQTANLGRREADLAVRHGRPETGDLYVVRVGTMACAAYRAAHLPEGVATGWIAYTEEQAHYAQSRWVAATLRQTGEAVVARASTVALQATAARSGAGVAILPCDLGDGDPALVRASAPIPALEAPHWLIVHRDLRRLPHVRAVMDWVTQRFAANRPELAGMP